ncbi:MAG TPA: hypothetical protein V6C86_08635 [Oculatellaceae cyanobacterium]
MNPIYERDPEELDNWVRSGHSMSNKDALELECLLKDDSYKERLQLLGYYVAHTVSIDSRHRYHELIFWFIDRYPDLEFLRRGFFRVSRAPGSPYEQITDLWRNKVAEDPSNINVLLSAAYQANMSDISLAKEYADRVQQLAPDLPSLKRLYSSIANHEEIVRQFTVMKFEEP